MIVEHGLDATVGCSGNHHIAKVERTSLNQQGRDRAAIAVDLGFNHDAARRAIRVGLELVDVGDQQEDFEEIIDTEVLLGRDLDERNVAAPLFRHDPGFRELLLDPIRVGGWKVDLVDGHDQRHVRRLDVGDRFTGRRHNAVVGRHYQHRDIGCLGTARAHGGKRFVARRVKEGKLPSLCIRPDRRRYAG